MQTPRNGRPEAMYSLIGSTSSQRRRFSIVSSAAPTPGTISASASSRYFALVVIIGRTPWLCTALATLCRFPAP